MESEPNSSDGGAQSLAYLTPGVYRRPQPAPRDNFAAVRTDVAGFVGFAERGPLPAPGVQEPDVKSLALRLTNWKEFRSIFGGFTFGYLAYAVRAFFENGGTTCYVVRVAATDAEPGERPRTASIALPGGVRASSTSAPPPSLKAPAAMSNTYLTVENASSVAAGDLIGIESEGTTEFSMVIGGAGDTLTLSRALTASHSAANTSLWIYDPALFVTAISPGSWGNRIRLEVTPLEAGSQVRQFALRVTLEPGSDRSAPTEQEFYSHLSLDKASAFYAPKRINGISNLIVLNIPKAEFKLLVDGGPAARGPVKLQGGWDGLRKVTARDFTGSLATMRGLRLLEEVDEVSILCVPDAVFVRPALAPPSSPPASDPCEARPKPVEAKADDEDLPALDDSTTENIYRAMIDQCERRRDRVAILDAPPRQTTAQLTKWAARFHTRFGALYHPWLKIPDRAEIEGPMRNVPPGGHVAGVYARIDNQFGVHRPPANAALEFVTAVAEEVDSIQQESLNPRGVNVIRSFAGKGIRVWGARSLAGLNDADWRYIHTRRLMSMIEESVDDSMQWAVFEPNTEALRRTMVHSLSVFLEKIWRQGGLKGAVASEGFYVRCDETNNPQSVVDLGQIVCQVGVAVAAPMEFLVFEIRQQPTGAQILEL